MNKDEQRGQQIARKVLREMLGDANFRADVAEVANGYVETYAQGLYARKHINILCREMRGTLTKRKTQKSPGGTTC